MRALRDNPRGLCPANMLIRLYQEEQPRAVLVGWEGGHEFDEYILEQFEVLPEFVAAYGLGIADD